MLRAFVTEDTSPRLSLIHISEPMVVATPLKWLTVTAPDTLGVGILFF